MSPNSALALDAVSDPAGTVGTVRDPADAGRVPTPPPPTQNEAPPRFRADIQGIRAVAVLLVVVFHSGFGWSGGFLGVDVFFVVSGFVIGRLLVHELSGSGRIGLGDFYSRRVRRILPALVVVLVVIAIGSVVILAPPSGLQPLATKVGVASALFSANFALLNLVKTGYFDLSSEWNPLLHMWTLAVEEQFYLVFPCFLILVHHLARRGRRRGVARTMRWLFVACVVVAVASFAAGVVIAASHGFPRGDLDKNRQLAFYLLPTRAWEFLAGVFVVFLERSRFRITDKAAAGAALVGFGMILWSGWFVTGATPTPGVIALVPVLGAAILIAAGNTTTVGLSRLLGTRPVAWVGDRSYGWYLWHWPAIVFTRISFPTVPSWVLLVAGVASLIPTELSYRFVERPIRFDRTWRGRRAVKLAVLCCGISLLAFAGAAIAQRATRGLHLPGHPEQAHLDATVGCSRMLPDDPRVASRCTWQAPDSRGTVVLIGDSHAGALSEVLRDRSLAAGYDFTLVTYSACRFAAVDIATPDHPCHRWVAAWSKELSENRRSLVVIANRASWTVHDPASPLLDPATGRQTTDEATKARIWEDGLSRTLADVTRPGTPVAVVATVPQFDDFEVRTCATWRVWLAPGSCSVTEPRAVVDADRAASLPAERRAVHAHPSAHLVDFVDDLCDATTCSTTRDGIFQYRDESHLSVPGARALGPVVDRDVLSLAQPRDT